METEKVSIIVPVYNASVFLPRCIESICKQSYKNLELILIDDGSTDNSLEICKTFSSKYSFIKVISQPNRGVSAARNAGIQAATGDLITFVDSDDWLDVGTIETAKEFLRKYHADVVTYGWRRVFEDSEDIQECVKHFEVIEDNQLIIKRILENYSALGGGYPWNKLWRRNIFQSIELFESELFYFEDLEWVIRMMMHIRKMVVCPLPLYNYYIRASSITNCLDNKEKNELGYHQSIEKILHSLLPMEEVFRWFKDKYNSEIVNGIIHARRKRWIQVESYLLCRLRGDYMEIIKSKRISLFIKLRCMMIVMGAWRKLK